MASKVTPLLKSQHVTTLCSRSLHCWPDTLIRKTQRFYPKSYPTSLQFPDGSTITIQYPEQVGVIKLPLDLSTLTEEQRKLKLLKRLPKVKVKIQEEIEDDFDETRYLKLKKK